MSKQVVLTIGQLGNSLNWEFIDIRESIAFTHHPPFLRPQHLVSAEQMKWMNEFINEF